jgi:hypothetical protein
VENVDPSRIFERLIMNGGDNLRKQVTGGRWAWQSVGKDLDGALSLKARLSYCEKSARLSGALSSCTY